ncbi:hypothetical protein ABZ439_05110 [Streptomyces sp. NPDC005840]|uniref:hypothetical protein n=1 Tax=Streptomyces sp. NPDC005840 TaxID=3157072 RepID=UPI0033F28903
MSGVRFELRRAESGRGRRGEVFSWAGQVDGVGDVRLEFPTEHSDYPAEYCEVAVSGEGFPLTTFLGLRYLRRPLLARGELRVEWEPADLSRNALLPGRRGRALRIHLKDRAYVYTQRGGKRGHELSRDGATVLFERSSWRLPQTISGTCLGAADALDIGVGLVLEGVYTRNLTATGALVSLPGRLLNRISDL